MQLLKSCISEICKSFPNKNLGFEILNSQQSFNAACSLSENHSLRYDSFILPIVGTHSSNVYAKRLSLPLSFFHGVSPLYTNYYQVSHTTTKF